MAFLTFIPCTVTSILTSPLVPPLPKHFGFSIEHIPDHSPVLSYFKRTASQQFDSINPSQPCVISSSFRLRFKSPDKLCLSLSGYNHSRLFFPEISLLFLLQLNHAVDSCRICMFPSTYGSNKCVFALNSYTTLHINICC